MSKRKENPTTKENITNDIQKADAVRLSFDEIIKNNLVESELINRATAQGVDLYTCPLNPWKALLQEVGVILWSSDRKELKIDKQIHYNGCVRPSNYNMYDIYKIKQLCNVYIYISHKYNKLISISYFAYMCNMMCNDMYSILDINNHPESLTEFNNTRSEILKMIYNERENNIKEKCFESASPVGVIAIANREYNWSGTGQNNGITTGQAQRLDALPDISGLKALNG